jgi:hypothetical protein
LETSFTARECKMEQPLWKRVSAVPQRVKEFTQDPKFQDN